MSAWVTGRRSQPRRPSTAARGLGYDHQRQRKAWAPQVKLGLVDCHICGERIYPHQAWDLDHILPSSMGGKDGPRHPAHRRCNIAKGGRNRLSRSA